MKVTILGAGAYALALSKNINKEHNITIWTKFEEEKDNLINLKENPKVLPGVKIDGSVYITTNIKEAVASSTLIILAVPAPAVNEVSIELKKYIKNYQHICIASKGIEENKCLFVYDIFTKHVKTKNLSIISGPSFAIDMVKGVPIGLTLATKNKTTENIVRQTFLNSNIKFRSTRDVIGVEICGSIKNVIALASGIFSGMGYPESTQAMLVTESLHDIKGLIKALGGNPKTILSFAGFGDLMLTATSSKSRNFQFGVMIGKKTSKEKLDEYRRNTTIEGVNTLKSIYKLLKRKKVDMPIIDLIYSIIYKEEDIEKLVQFLIVKS